MRFTVRDAGNQYNVNGYATNVQEYVKINNIASKNADGSASFNVYIMADDEESQVDIQVEALDADNNVIDTRLFEDVVVRNGYKTTYRGTFFVTTGISISFVAEDMAEFDVVNF